MGSVFVGEMVTMVFPLKIGETNKEFTFHYSLLKDKRLEGINAVRIALDSYLRQAGATGIEIGFEEIELESDKVQDNGK